MLPASIQKLWRRYTSRLAARSRTRETPDEQSAREYWDHQVEEDHQRRGVDDKHA
jgi:hypothetical protein